MPRCSECGSLYPAHLYHCPICPTPDPGRSILGAVDLPVIGQTFDGHRITCVHLVGGGKLEIVLCGTIMIPLANWRDVQPAASEPEIEPDKSLACTALASP